MPVQINMPCLQYRVLCSKLRSTRFEFFVYLDSIVCFVLVLLQPDILLKIPEGRQQ